MDESKLGPIHEANTPPVHVGVYELPDSADADGRAFAYWDGKAWGSRKWQRYGDGTVQATVERAHKSGMVGCFYTDARRWRGLAEKPN